MKGTFFRGANSTDVNAQELHKLLNGGIMGLLRLEPQLEEAFRNHFRKHAASLIRKSVFGLIALYLLVVVPSGLLMEGPGKTIWFWAAVFPIGGVLVIIFGFSRLKNLERYVDWLLGWCVFVCLTGTICAALILADNRFSLIASFETIYIIIIAFSVLRLPTVIALRSCIAAFLLGLTITLSQGLIPVWLYPLLFFFVPLLICAVNGYMLEYAARRDFSLMLCQQHEKRMLLKEITALGDESGDIHVILDITLNRVCHHMDWILGHAFVIATDGNIRGSQRYLNTEQGKIPSSLESLLVAQETLDLMAKATRTARPICKTYPANRDGKTPINYFLFPVLLKGSVVAVLDFYSLNSDISDETQYTLMEQVCSQLGRVFERYRQQDVLRDMAMNDPLTGMPNRTSLLQSLKAAASRADRNSDYGFTVLLLDMDHFKWVNDSLGHLSGDHLLVDFARRLRAACATPCAPMMCYAG